MRRWRFDEAGWAGARAALRLPADVVTGLPPVPAPTTAREPVPAPTAAVLATREPLRAALVVAAQAPVTCDLVQHRGARAVVSRIGCAGTPVGAMTVAALGTAVAVEVAMGTVDDLVAAVADRLGLPDVAPGADDPVTHDAAVEVPVHALAGGGRLAPWVEAALGGGRGPANRDVVRIDGPAGPTAAALLWDDDAQPSWVRAAGTTLQLRATSVGQVRAWLVRALAAQLAHLAPVGAADG